MVSGLWTVQFEAMGNRGAGVAVFTNGKVLGGDSGFTYTGTFQEAGDSLKADIWVKNFERSVPSLVGANEYDLHIEGKLQGDRATGTATSTSAALRGNKINFTLIKREGM
jgi:autotransporter translocation and assembly factor TamB